MEIKNLGLSLILLVIANTTFAQQTWSKKYTAGYISLVFNSIQLSNDTLIINAVARDTTNVGNAILTFDEKGNLLSNYFHLDTINNLSIESWEMPMKKNNGRTIIGGGYFEGPNTMNGYLAKYFFMIKWIQ